MFPYFYTPIYSTSTGNLVLGTGEENSYNGNVDHGCFQKYAFNGPVAHHGIRGSSQFPEIVREAALRRRLNNEDGWIGNLAHDLFEDSLFAWADRSKQRPDALTQKQLLDLMWETYDREWEKSLHYDAQEFLGDMRRKRSNQAAPIWLLKHAVEVLEGRVISEEADRKTYTRYREKLTVTADYIAANLSSMIQHTPYNKWHILEGKQLFEGDVVCDEGVTQAEARSRPLMPSFDVEVDGVMVRVFCTIDFAYWLPDRLVIADLKTGKVKPSHFEQTGLYGFYITETNPEIDPEQIIFRLMYPAVDEFPEIQFNKQMLLETQAKTKERIRKIFERFVTLDDASLDQPGSYQAIARSYPLKDAKCIWTLGYYKRHNKWPDKMPLLEGQATESERSVPEPGELANFIIQKLSPSELTRGLIEDRDQALVVAETAFATAKERGLRVTSEWVNRRILRDLVPSLNAMDLLNSFSVSHIKLALPQKFPPTGAEHTPDWCRGCVFYSICEPGQYAFENYLNNRKKS